MNTPPTARNFAAPTAPARGPALLAALAARAWKLPSRTNSVRVSRSMPIPMSDGVTLIADHYVPQVSRAVPTILVRSPYGRGAPYSALYAQLYAERGFHVVLQSCRGTFGSGGIFDPMRHEADDGQDTVAWLRTQHWFDRRLVALGFSYLGFAHWALALDPPPELVAAVVHMGPHDFSTAAYRNGVFDWYNFLGWSETVGRQHEVGPVRNLLRMATAERRLAEPLQKIPLAEGSRALLGDVAPWFDGWLQHPHVGDSFWAQMQHGEALQRLSVPTLLVGGWHDLFLQQTLEQYAALRDREIPVRLLVGSWSHLDFMIRGGPAVAESLGWLSQCTGGPGISRPSTASARVNVEASGSWRELSQWPPLESCGETWYLGGYGTLERSRANDIAELTFRYDPRDPTPTVGGAIMSLRAGPRDNRAIEKRTDLLLFTSAPLDTAVDVIGEVRAQIVLTRDNPNADLFVRLCDVAPDGRSLNVCDGIVRLTDDNPLTATVPVSLTATAHRFEAGHRIRVQIAGGAHPRFARNLGTGGLNGELEDMRSTTYAIGLDGDSGSAVRLPVYREVSR